MFSNLLASLIFSFAVGVSSSNYDRTPTKKDKLSDSVHSVSEYYYTENDYKYILSHNDKIYFDIDYSSNSAYQQLLSGYDFHDYVANSFSHPNVDSVFNVFWDYYTPFNFYNKDTNSTFVCALQYQYKADSIILLSWQPIGGYTNIIFEYTTNGVYTPSSFASTIDWSKSYFNSAFYWGSHSGDTVYQYLKQFITYESTFRNYPLTFTLTEYNFLALLSSNIVDNFYVREDDLPTYYENTVFQDVRIPVFNGSFTFNGFSYNRIYVVLVNPYIYTNSAWSYTPYNNTTTETFTGVIIHKILFANYNVSGYYTYYEIPLNFETKNFNLNNQRYWYTSNNPIIINSSYSSDITLTHYNLDYYREDTFPLDDSNYNDILNLLQSYTISTNKVVGENDSVGNLIRIGFFGLIPLLDIEILPNIRLIYFIMLPVILIIITAVVKLFKR